MQEYDIRVQKFKAADNAEDALRFAKELSALCRADLSMAPCLTVCAVDVPEIVLKAQVHAGGRGKGTFSSGLKSGVHLIPA